MNYTIFINQIINPVEFANGLIDFLFVQYDKIEISIYGKIDAVDRKKLKGIIKNPILGNLVFKRYDLSLEHEEFQRIKNIIEYYFNNDWGLIIDENHKGLFSFKKSVFHIDCVDEQDKNEKEQFFNKLIKSSLIDKLEIIEDNYVDPYSEKNKL